MKKRDPIRKLAPCAVVMVLLLIACSAIAQDRIRKNNGETDWPAYGNDPGGMRYSPLRQIDASNVAKLRVAWTFHTRDVSDGSKGWKRSGLETTPILVDGTLYLTTAFNRVIALDPSTGDERWAFDPQLDLSLDYGDGLINRGVASWLDASRDAKQPCRRRIYEATLDARLVALDGATGKPCGDFGHEGQVLLRDVPGYESRNLGEHPQGWYHMTSPPVVIDDLVIVGSAIDDNNRADMPSGVVRAFDARTGALALELGSCTAKCAGEVEGRCRREQNVEHGRGECVVGDGGRSEPRSSVYSNRQRESGLLRRAASG